MAQLSGVSKATVSRLFKRLGYDKYKDMRDELRTLRQSGMPLTDQRDAVQGNTLLARHYKQEMANLTQWVNALDARQFAEALTAMVAARRIVVVEDLPRSMLGKVLRRKVREQLIASGEFGQ